MTDKVKMNLEKQIEFWKKSAEEDLETAELLFKNKRFDHCLFFCHLLLEKLLKGLVVYETKDFPPYIHELDKLAKFAKLELSKEQKEDLKIINTFNISGRYKDYKLGFYQGCTKKYASDYFSKTKEIFLWFKEQYPQK